MTNAAALTALQSLNNTNQQLQITQARISTGYRVATASDNAAYWSIATSMRSDNQGARRIRATELGEDGWRADRNGFLQ